MSRRGQLLFGAALGRRGVLVGICIAIAMLITAGACVTALLVARGGATSPLSAVPDLASSALAWGAGVTLAFGSAVHALRRDRKDGVRHLLRSKGMSVGAYLFARVGGLALVLAVVIGGGTLITGLVSTLAATRVGAASTVLQATVASVLYATMFSIVLAPVALASLGARARVGGYLWLLFILVLPELFESWTRGLLPKAWGDLVSIPAALASFRAALMPPGVDFVRCARASIFLLLVLAVAVLVLRREIAKLDAEEAP